MSMRSNPNVKFIPETIDKKTGVVTPSRYVHFSDKPGKTQQAPALDTDINTMIATFSKIGPRQANGLPFVPPPQFPLVYGDSTLAPKSLSSAMQVVIDARKLFMQLPAELRQRMDNKPENFESWLQDDNNKELAIKFGLRKPAPKAPPSNDPIPHPVPTPTPPVPPKDGKGA